MAKLHIPVEIWMMIAEHVSEEDYQNLVGLSPVFYNMIMDARYKNVHVDYIGDYMIKMLSRFAIPAVATRVRRLHISPRYKTCLSLTWYERQEARLRHVLETFAKSHRSTSVPEPGLCRHHRQSAMKAGRSLVAAVKLMSNVTKFSIDWCRVPNANCLERVIPVAWETFGATLQSLTLGGTVADLKTLMSSLLVPTASTAVSSSPLPALEELHLEFVSGAVVSIEAQPGDEYILEQIVAPFINGFTPQLRCLSISSWSRTLDISCLFSNIGPFFPLLHHLSLRGVFEIEFFADASGLARLVSLHAPTLRTIDLSFNAEDHVSERLTQWLTEMETNVTTFDNLETLRIFPARASPGFNALLSFVQLSARTLTTLHILHRYLLHEEIVLLATIFSSSPGVSKLVVLRINVERVDPSLFDLLATTLPGLRELSLHSANHYITPLNMQARSYMDWKLYDLGIWGRQAKVNGSIMRLVAESVPSIKSFWGQGNTTVHAIRYL